MHKHKVFSDGLRRWFWSGDDFYASLELSRLNTKSIGVRFGRNGDDSDVGLDLHLWFLGSAYARLRWRPWTKAFTVRDRGQRDRMLFWEARHTGFRLHPFDDALLLLEFDVPWNMARGAVAKWREVTLTNRMWRGRTKCDVEVTGVGETVVPMPEGNYPATWRRERRTWTHPERLGPLRDAVRGVLRRDSVWLEVEGGIPHEGKGENSWDCGMDGLFGCGGSTVEDAVANAVRCSLRDRERYGGPHDLPRPMTVTEASNV